LAIAIRIFALTGISAIGIAPRFFCSASVW